MNKKIQTSSKGRKCKSHGCQHILSIYNHEVYCRVHAGDPSYKQDFKRPPVRQVK